MLHIVDFDNDFLKTLQIKISNLIENIFRLEFKKIDKLVKS